MCGGRIVPAVGGGKCSIHGSLCMIIGPLHPSVTTMRHAQPRVSLIISTAALAICASLPKLGWPQSPVHRIVWGPGWGAILRKIVMKVQQHVRHHATLADGHNYHVRSPTD